MAQLPQRPLNFEEAANVLKIKKKAAKNKEVQKGPRPISVDDEESKKKFLRYAITLLKDRRLKTLLKLRVEGYSHKQIAWHFKVKPGIVVYLEKEAVKRVKDEIARRRLTGVPIVGGMN